MKIKLELFTYGAYIEGGLQGNKSHSHECYQLCLAKEPSLIIIGSEEIKLLKGECLLLNKLAPHQISNSDWITILVDNESQLGDKLKSKLKEEDFIFIDQSSDIFDIFSNPSSYLDLLKKEFRKEVIQALEFIPTHDHNCQLNEVANFVALSPDRFRHVFKSEVGISFKNYLTWQKIKKAFKLITLNPEINLIDLALSAGFSDQAHLTKTISKTFGFTPNILKKSL